MCEENGVEFIEIPVAFDGISVVVNKQNDFATDVTSEQLKTLWEPAAEGKITQWSQVNPEWPDQETQPLRPRHRVRHVRVLQRDHRRERGGGQPLSDFEASEDDNVLVQGVSGDQNALGYFGFSYYENNQDTLKVLAVDGVEPTADTIRSGEYLLSRPLFIYVSTKALKNNEAVEPFVDFYLSEQNLDRLVEAAKYVTLPRSLAQESRDAVRGPHHRHRVHRRGRAEGRRPGGGARAVAVRVCGVDTGLLDSTIDGGRHQPALSAYFGHEAFGGCSRCGGI